jgi:hypothetical protein
MKTKHHVVLAIALALGVFHCANLPAQETNGVPVRIGVYDSRAVAYAWFCSDAHQRQLKELIEHARAARAAGETNRFETLAADLRRQQDQIHRESFSTAPPDEALAEIKARIPEIERQAGVTALISKWDDAALKNYPGSASVDVTDLLVRKFIQPTEKQAKTISSLEKSRPLPLDKCNELISQGKI